MLETRRRVGLALLVGLLHVATVHAATQHSTDRDVESLDNAESLDYNPTQSKEYAMGKEGTDEEPSWAKDQSTPKHTHIAPNKTEAVCTPADSIECWVKKHMAMIETHAEELFKASMPTQNDTIAAPPQKFVKEAITKAYDGDSAAKTDRDAAHAQKKIYDELEKQQEARNEQKTQTDTADTETAPKEGTYDDEDNQNTNNVDDDFDTESASDMRAAT